MNKKKKKKFIFAFSRPRDAISLFGRTFSLRRRSGRWFVFAVFFAFFFLCFLFAFVFFSLFAFDFFSLVLIILLFFSLPFFFLGFLTVLKRRKIKRKKLIE